MESDMGFLWKVITFVAPDKVAKVLDIPISAIEKITKTDKGTQDEIKKFSATQTNHTRLLIDPNIYSRSEKYNVFDENQTVKYTVKGELLSLKHHLHIFDAKGQEIGAIKEKLFAFRNPFSFEHSPIDYVLFSAGRKLGKVKRRSRFFKTKYIIDFNKWKIVSKELSLKYDVYDGDKIVLMVTSMSKPDGHILFVDIYEKNIELVGLMIALVFDSLFISKGERASRARTNRFWGFKL